MICVGHRRITRHVDVTELLTNDINTVSPFHRYLESIGYVPLTTLSHRLIYTPLAAHQAVHYVPRYFLNIRADIQRTLDLLIATKN